MQLLSRKSAFSLVELSIVLVILGLLTGGILGGQALIRAAEIRSVAAEYQRYASAIHTFRDKYMQIPGDMPNAGRFWGYQAGAPADGRDATCGNLDHTAPATGIATCNGDGNGRIDGIPATNVYERYRMWHHLANAGLIEGTYTGVPGPASVYDTVAGSNTPRSKAEGANWSCLWSGAVLGDPILYDADYGNSCEVRANGTFAFLKPEEAWNIDTKLDDGRPAYGTVLTYKPNGLPNCATTAVSASAEYRLQETTKACSLIFLRAL